MADVVNGTPVIVNGRAYVAADVADLLSALADAAKTEAKLAAALRVIEAAEAVNRIYEGLRMDANDGEFALWSEDDLVAALHNLDSPLRDFREAK